MRSAIRATDFLEDDQVDRFQVKAQRCVKPRNTNKLNFISLDFDYHVT